MSDQSNRIRMRYSPREIVACLRREGKMRERVYPRLVAERKMSPRMAEREKQMMKQAADMIESRWKVGPEPELFEEEEK